MTVRVNSAVARNGGQGCAHGPPHALGEIRKVEEAKTGLTCEPVTLYQGGEYWLYRYQKFTDVPGGSPELQV